MGDVFDGIIRIQRILDVVNGAGDDIIDICFGVGCGVILRDLGMLRSGHILIGDHGADALQFGRDAIDGGCRYRLDFGVLVVEGHGVAWAIGEERLDVLVGLAGNDIHLGGRRFGGFGLRSRGLVGRLRCLNGAADRINALRDSFGLRCRGGLSCVGFQGVDAVGVVIGGNFLRPAGRKRGRYDRRARRCRGRALLRLRCGFFGRLCAQDNLSVLLTRLDAARNLFLCDMCQHLRIGLCGFCTEIPILRRQIAKIFRDGLHGAE